MERAVPVDSSPAQREVHACLQPSMHVNPLQQLSHAERLQGPPPSPPPALLCPAVPSHAVRWLGKRAAPLRTWGSGRLITVLVVDNSSAFAA